MDSKNSVVVEVPLTRGQIARVRLEHLPLVDAHKWHFQPQARGHGSCYAVTEVREGGKRRCLSMHRLITAAKPGEQVDHVDGDGLNNCIENLRKCTPRENTRGFRTKPKGASSTFRGVSWNIGILRWVAHIRVDGKLIYLGSSNEEAETARLYDAAAVRFFGAFAHLNFPA